MNKLAVVIITRNEEKNIARAIESVLQATKDFPDTQVVLVDSVSTDRTINIAQSYPIDIIQLDSEYFLSPAAGRYVGLQQSQSDYIFFLDGDMQLHENWFKQAIPLLEADAQLAGLAGKCQEFIFNERGDEIIEEKEDRFEVGEKPKLTHSLGGSALYRRAVLEEVGGFNPYLANEEELELGLRINTAAYKTLRIPVPMSIHYTIYYSNENPSGVTLRQVRRDWCVGRYSALGKVLRLLLANPLLKVYLKTYKRALFFIGFYLSGLFSALLSIAHLDHLPLVVWLTLLVGAILLRTLYKAHLTDSALFFLDYSLQAYGFIAGFLLGTPPVKQYQPQLTFIKTGSKHVS